MPDGLPLKIACSECGVTVIADDVIPGWPGQWECENCGHPNDGLYAPDLMKLPGRLGQPDIFDAARDLQNILKTTTVSPHLSINTLDETLSRCTYSENDLPLITSVIENIHLKLSALFRWWNPCTWKYRSYKKASIN